MTPPPEGGSEIPVGDRPWLLVMALEGLDLRANHGRLRTAVVVYLAGGLARWLHKRWWKSRMGEWDLKGPSFPLQVRPTGWQADRIDAHWRSEFWFTGSLNHSTPNWSQEFWDPRGEVVHTRAEICKLHASKDGNTGVKEHLSRWRSQKQRIIYIFLSSMYVPRLVKSPNQRRCFVEHIQKEPWKILGIIPQSPSHDHSVLLQQYFYIHMMSYMMGYIYPLIPQWVYKKRENLNRKA